jgi:hypothetical protein
MRTQALRWSRLVERKPSLAIKPFPSSAPCVVVRDTPRIRLPARPHSIHDSALPAASCAMVVTYNAGPFFKLPLASCSGFGSAHCVRFATCPYR